MSTPEIDLPLIDLSTKNLSDPNSKAAASKLLIDSFSEAGFCLITGLEGYDVEELFKWHKWFYLDLPEDERIKQLATKVYLKRPLNWPL